MRILIRKGRVIDPVQNLDEVCDLLIENGKIAEIGESIKADDSETIDAGGLVVCPGLIDMHVHLREPGREDEETIESGTKAALKGGFTSVVSMPNTTPVIEGDEGVRFILSKAREVALARVFPVAALSKGQRGEELSEIGSAITAGAVAISDDGQPVVSSALMRRALEYVKMFSRPVISHAEDIALSHGGVINEGRISAILGLKGIPPESEEIAVRRDVILARLTRSHLHVAHVSTRGSIEAILEAKRLGVHVTCEVTPHHFTLTDEAVKDFDTNAKVNPPLRSKSDRDALRHALRDQVIDAIASDHAPHSIEEKDQEFAVAPFGMIGLETTLGLACKELYHTGIVPLTKLVELLSTNPAKILRLGVGTLKKGSPADVTMFDPNKEWVVEESGILSKSKNTPFLGWKLKGKAINVIVDGRIVMRDGTIEEVS